MNAQRGIKMGEAELLGVSLSAFFDLFEFFSDTLRDLRGRKTTPVSGPWQDYFGDDSPSLEDALDQAALAVLECQLKLMTLMTETRLEELSINSDDPFIILSDEASLYRKKAEEKLMELYDRLRTVKIRLGHEQEDTPTGTPALQGNGTMSLDLLSRGNGHPDGALEDDELNNTFEVTLEDEKSFDDIVAASSQSDEVDATDKSTVAEAVDEIGEDAFDEEPLSAEMYSDDDEEHQPDVEEKDINDPVLSIAEMDSSIEDTTSELPGDTSDEIDEEPLSTTADDEDIIKEVESEEPSEEAQFIEVAPQEEEIDTDEDDEVSAITAEAPDSGGLEISEQFFPLVEVGGAASPDNEVAQSGLSGPQPASIEPMVGAGRYDDFDHPDGDDRKERKPVAKPSTFDSPMSEEKTEDSKSLKVPPAPARPSDIAEEGVPLFSASASVQEKVDTLIQSISRLKKVHRDASDLKVKTASGAWTLSLPYFHGLNGNGQPSAMLDLENFIGIHNLAFRGVLDAATKQQMDPSDQRLVKLVQKLHKYFRRLYANVASVIGAHSQRIFPNTGESIDPDIMLLLEADLVLFEWKVAEDVRFFRDLFQEKLVQPFNDYLAESQNKLAYLKSVAELGGEEHSS